ncbi:MAG: type IV pilin protein [Saccharospirillum sp.]|nr:type IV pilin protein [Saccharospirillum sp.]
MHQSRCNLAQADLTELAQFMERRFSTRFDYRTDAGTNPTLPFTTSPRDGNSTAFNIAFDGAVAQGAFTLQATPVAGMVDAIDCGNDTGPSGEPTNILTIDEQGNRNW